MFLTFLVPRKCLLEIPGPQKHLRALSYLWTFYYPQIVSLIKCLSTSALEKFALVLLSLTQYICLELSSPDSGRDNLSV